MVIAANRPKALSIAVASGIVVRLSGVCGPVRPMPPWLGCRAARGTVGVGKCRAANKGVYRMPKDSTHFVRYAFGHR